MPGKRDEANLHLLPEIRDVYREHKGRYGSPRIYRELIDLGMPCGRHRVARLMRKHGIAAKTRRRFVRTTDSKHDYPVAANLLKREFTVAAPNKVWCADITYILTMMGWVYLATVIDLFSRKIVGWALSERIDRVLVCSALRMAIMRRCPGPGLIAHSDRGVQYASDDYQVLLASHKMVCSMSRKGDCWDNAVQESFYGRFKVELVYECDYRALGEVQSSVFGYIEGYYNTKRRHSTLGYLCPDEFERRYYAAKELTVFAS